MPPAEDPVLDRFRRALLADRASGISRPLADYQRQFPGADNAIAAEYERLPTDSSSPAATRWRRVRAVFEQAVELPAAARAALLQHELGDDEAALAEVEELLAAESKADEFLTPPSAATLSRVAPSAGPQPEAGAHIGDFALERELGNGGQGTVWSATDTRVGRKVALKLLPAGASWNASVLARFRREAAITSRLEHPGICTVYQVELESSQPYVAMRLVDGESLAQLLARARCGEVTIDVATAVRIVEAAARAVHAAHNVGVVHRDIKPGNLMRTPAGEIVVLDFGIARELAGDSPQLTHTGDVFGTPSYMAPEQIEAGTVDARIDVWALGVTLFELLTLQQPFQAPTREGLYRAILSQEPTAPPAARDLPADLRVILATALQKEPIRRYDSALALADDLTAFAAGRPIAARPIGALGRLLRWTRREPRAAMLVGALGLSLLVVATVTGYLAAQRGRLTAGAAALAQRERAVLVRDFTAGVLRLESTEDRLRALLSEEPALTNIRCTLAMSLAENQRVGDAIVLCDQAPADQENPRALDRVRAMVLRQADRAPEADRLEEQLGTPRNALEAYFMSLAADKDGKPEARERARDAIRLAFVFMPGANETYLERLLMCSFDSTTPDESNDLKRAALALETLYPDSSLAWFYIGLARSKTDPERARAANRRAVELDVGLAQPYFMEHVFQMMDGEFDAARATFERAMTRTQTEPERQTLLILRARRCLACEQFADALDAADRALVIHDESITVLLLKARAQLGLDETAAHSTLRHVLELAPDNAEAKQLLDG